jgi:hypothetical protein
LSKKKKKKNKSSLSFLSISFLLNFLSFSLFAALGEIDDSNVLPAVVLFSRELIEFETAVYLSVRPMENSIYVSAGGWDKSLNSCEFELTNNTTKKALTPFFPIMTKPKKTKILSFSFVRFPLFSNETITHAAKHTIITQA